MSKIEALPYTLSFRSLSVASLFLATTLVGCGGNSTWIEPPEISADSSAAKAIELYDTDGDRKLNEVELEQVPGLKAALNTVDTDKDGQASEAEIADRIRSWQKHSAGLTALLADVTMDGNPLREATVTFEPESFLGDDIETAVGTTTKFGSVAPSIPKENRPTPETPAGLQLGFYRVRVSKKVNGSETIPAKYNTETTLGQQVAPDDPAVVRSKIRFNLSSR